MARLLEFTLNGRNRVDAVAENMLLLYFLREQLGLTGTKTGCDGGECGACTVLIDDRPTLSCLTLAATIGGKCVDTIESLGHDGQMSAGLAADTKDHVRRRLLLGRARRFLRQFRK